MFNAFKQLSLVFPGFRFVVFAIAALFASVSGAVDARAAVYEVKPNSAIETIAQVPWATLQPGDLILIHWRPASHNEKWVIGRSGTEQAPIIIRGVPGPNGELPVIDGRNAVTPPGLNFWSENRGVIKIGGSNVPSSSVVSHIVIENLEIRSAHPSYSFTDDSGSVQSYSSSASSIFIELGENITIRNCRIHDSANGFFVASSDSAVSKNILVEGNYIFGNGVSGSIFQHNVYTAAIGITFQYNRFGPPRSGAPGVNLKDRSAGSVVRYNWIEGGNRNLDMVDGEDSTLIRNAPEYRQTFVYGNILIKQEGGNNQSVHYGGDSGTTGNYRKGKLYFYNNTLYSLRPGTTVAMRLSTNEEVADARNNIFYVTAAGTSFAMLAEAGTLVLVNNWAKTGWRNSHEAAFSGTVSGGATTVTGASPLFVDPAALDFKLQAGSPAVDAGSALNADVLPDHPVQRQYVGHQANEARPTDATIDIGAFEHSSAAPLVIVTSTLPDPVRIYPYHQVMTASGGSGVFIWSVTSGALPSGLFLDPNAGVVRGRARLPGPASFTLTASDAANPTLSVSKEFTVFCRLHN